MPPAKLPSHLVKQRRLYQRGLLAWLRGDDDGAVAMREAVGAIADATTSPPLRAFWWTIGALFDAVIEHGLDAGFGVKQLAARIDLQIRRVVEGSAKVADRLRREVLYYVAISAPVAPSVQAVQRAFRLAGLIPSAEVLNADLVRLQPLLREARDQLVRRQGRVAQVHLGSRGEPAEAQADAGRGAPHRRRDRQRRADEARVVAGRAARQVLPPAASPNRSRWSTRPACCSPRARSRTTRA